jgi:hypothetical protein
LISTIVDAAYELARRRLLEGNWRAAEAAAVTGLANEPGLERRWSIRILAARGAANAEAVQKAVDRLVVIVDELGGDLEPATDELIEQFTERMSLKVRRPRPGSARPPPARVVSRHQQLVGACPL